MKKNAPARKSNKSALTGQNHSTITALALALELTAIAFFAMAAQPLALLAGVQ